MNSTNLIVIIITMNQTIKDIMAKSLQLSSEVKTMHMAFSLMKKEKKKKTRMMIQSLVLSVCQQDSKTSKIKAQPIMASRAIRMIL